MSQLHVRQIAGFVEQNFGGLVDLTDVDQQPADQLENHRLTRSLAAFALVHLSGISEQDAANSVTDAFDDNGIDAIHYDRAGRILYLVQAKWRHDGNAGLALAEAQAFMQGLKDLVNARWNRFNHKIQAMQQDLEDAINDARTKILLVLATTGQQAPGAHAQRVINDALAEINDPVEIISFKGLLQADLYTAVAHGALGAPIDFDVVLFDWGQVRDPYHAYYGQVAASDIAQWWNQHYPRLFAPNIRMFLGATEVNQKIVDVLAQDPAHFWYFNNGITALCSTVSKKPIGGNSRDSGTFECSNVQIVNGAQTAGAIAAALQAGANVADARVTIRLISLEGCPDGFDRLITRATNTQNRVESRDFVALDQEQERIRNELALEGVTYAYKSGETAPAVGAGCELTEATVARACAQDTVDLSVIAKGNIGRLWDDINAAPYRILFNGGVNGPTVWHQVQVLRTVEARLRTQASQHQGRERLLRIHGNRFVLHHVFRRTPQINVDAQGILTQAQTQAIEAVVDQILHHSQLILTRHYPDSYLASLFKNQTKSRFVSGELDGALPPPP